jgi:hypothetical protein
MLENSDDFVTRLRLFLTGRELSRCEQLLSSALQDPSSLRILERRPPGPTASNLASIYATRQKIMVHHAQEGRPVWYGLAMVARSLGDLGDERILIHSIDPDSELSFIVFERAVNGAIVGIICGELPVSGKVE